MEKGKFDPYRIEIPEPIDIKFGTDNYVQETMPCAKFGASSTGDY